MTDSHLLGAFLGFFTGPRLAAGVRALVILVIGLVLARVLTRAITSVVRRGTDSERGDLAGRVAQYVLGAIAVTLALEELGFNLAVLLGAAGVASIAVGFAAQTSLSNLISGFLLYGERSFRIGDVLLVAGEEGEVLAVDLLSTKLRTFRNELVRIPNETMLKSKVVNATRFPIRRLDLEIPVAYRQDLAALRSLCLDVVEANAIALVEPEPLFFVKVFSESSVTVQLSVWCETSEWLAFKQSLPGELVRAFAGSDILPPYPHRVLVDPRATEEEAS